MRYISLIKLLYLADRRSLIETGYTLTGDVMISMSNGPVLSHVYDIIAHDAVQNWRLEYVSEPSEYFVSLVKSEPEADELSMYEIKLLDHTLPEWHDPQGSSTIIRPEEILQAEGVAPDEIKEIVAGAEDVWLLSEALAHAER